MSAQTFANTIPLGIRTNELPPSDVWQSLREGELVSEALAAGIKDAMGAKVCEVICMGDIFQKFTTECDGSRTAWFQVPLESPTVCVRVEWLVVPSVTGEAVWSWEAPDPAPGYLPSEYKRKLASAGILRYRVPGTDDATIKPGDSVVLRFTQFAASDDDGNVSGEHSYKLHYFSILQWVFPKGLPKLAFQNPINSTRCDELGQAGSFLWHYGDERSFPLRCVLAGVMPRDCGTELVSEIRVRDLSPTLLDDERSRLLFDPNLPKENLKFQRMKCQVVPCPIGRVALGGQNEVKLLGEGVQPTREDAHGAKEQRCDLFLDNPPQDIIGVIHCEPPQCYNVPHCGSGCLFEIPRALSVLHHALIVMPVSHIQTRTSCAKTLNLKSAPEASSTRLEDNAFNIGGPNISL